MKQVYSCLNYSTGTELLGPCLLTFVILLCYCCPCCVPFASNIPALSRDFPEAMKRNRVQTDQDRQTFSTSLSLSIPPRAGSRILLHDQPSLFDLNLAKGDPGPKLDLQGTMCMIPESEIYCSACKLPIRECICCPE